MVKCYYVETALPAPPMQQVREPQGKQALLRMRRVRVQIAARVITQCNTQQERPVLGGHVLKRCEHLCRQSLARGGAACAADRASVLTCCAPFSSAAGAGDTFTTSCAVSWTCK